MDHSLALRCATLSQDVYQEFSKIKFRSFPDITPRLFDIGATDTQVALLEVAAAQTLYIVFRGSSADKDWSTNLNMAQEQYEWSDEDKQAFRAQVSNLKAQVMTERELVYPDAYKTSSSPVRMHSGFVQAYLSVRSKIHEYLRSSAVKTCIITGHSLGGALATVCSVDVQYNFGKQMAVKACTFGSPKVGNKAFVESYQRRVPDTWRFVYGRDAVVGLPRWWQGDYEHVEQQMVLGNRWSWRLISGSIDDHQLSNYFKGIQALRG
jgi:triacylglycerol lipase